MTRVARKFQLFFICFPFVTFLGTILITHHPPSRGGVVRFNFSFLLIVFSNIHRKGHNMIDTELRRMLTNSVGDQKIILQNIIQGIANLQTELKALKIENKALKAALEEKNG
jgi:hypothetical protein